MGAIWTTTIESYGIRFCFHRLEERDGGTFAVQASLHVLLLGIGS